MEDKDFELGDLVWAKNKRFLWPGKISEPEGSSSVKIKKGQHFVNFFGTNNAAWILDKNITPHSDEMLKKYEAQSKMPEGLEEGIEEIKAESSKESKNTEEVIDTPNNKTMSALAGKSPKALKSTTKSPKAQTGKKRCIPKEPEGINSPPIKLMKRSPQKTSAKRNAFSNNNEKENLALSSIDNEDGEAPYIRMVFGKPDEPSSLPDIGRYAVGSGDNCDIDSFSYNAPSSCNGLSNLAVIHPYNTASSTTNQTKVILDRPVYPRPSTPVLDMQAVSEDIKNIIPTTKKIGFLGLGMMGRGMVKNLLHSKHNITVWNRTMERCDDFVDAGATRADTPFDVIKECDITFCCVSDAEASNNLVFGNWGVLKALNETTPGSKCYVEMSSIDPLTTCKIADAIIEAGGRFLEAPLIGNRELSEAGELLICCAGDESLYEECESCFAAISKKPVFLGPNAGDASKMNLTFSMLTGSICAALAEAMAMIEAFDLDPSVFLQIMEVGEISCPLMIKKGNQMLANDYETNTAVKHLQKDLDMALTQGNNCQQPLHIVAASNEIFKRTRMLRYSDHDIAAVLLGTRV